MGSPYEYRNIDIVKLIAKINNLNFKDYSYHAKDRPFNDFRYSVNYDKIKKLNWKPITKLEDKILEINNWYKKNLNFYKKR